MLLPLQHSRTTVLVCDRLIAGNNVNVLCRFASWIYSSDIIDFVETQPGDDHFYVTTYDPACPTIVQSYESRRNVHKYTCCPETYTEIIVNLLIAKRPG